MVPAAEGILKFPFQGDVQVLQSCLGSCTAAGSYQSAEWGKSSSWLVFPTQILHRNLYQGSGSVTQGQSELQISVVLKEG